MKIIFESFNIVCIELNILLSNQLHVLCIVNISTYYVRNEMFF